MPFIAKAVDFDSINYLPGFPSLSKYDCDPFSWNQATGGCKTAPVAIGRERPGVIDAAALIAALKQTGSKAPSVLGGLGSSGYASHAARRGLRGSDGREARHAARGMSGCGCGGSCGGCGSHANLGTFDITSMASIVSWLEANWMPLAIGAGVAWVLKRR